MTEEVKNLKNKYRSTIRKAQAKYRREFNSGSESIEFVEAQRTGGQFSFAHLETEEDVIKELYRANVYLNSNLMSPENFIESAKMKGEQYLDIFDIGTTADERSELGLDDDMASQLFSVYRRLQEQEHGQIGKGGLFESNAFLAYLYSYMVEGKSESYVQRKGNELLRNAHSKREFEFREQIPVEFEEQDSEIPDEYNDRGGRRYGKQTSKL